MEIRNIIGYEGLYVITDEGLIFNIATNHVVAKRVSEENTYSKIVLRDANGETKTCYVHRLVAEAFIPNPGNLPEVNHKNGIRYDNRVENLEWVSHRDNMLHCWKELHKRTGNGCRPVKGISIYDESDVIEFDSVSQAAEYCSVHLSAISRALRNGGTSAKRKWYYIDEVNE